MKLIHNTMRLHHMKTILTGFILMIFVTTGWTQSPQAKALIESTQQKINGTELLSGTFALDIFFDNQSEYAQEGEFVASGERIRVSMPDYEYVFDGTTSWMYLMERNEVQIQEAVSDEMVAYNPQKMMLQFTGTDFEYEIADKQEKMGKMLVKVDFKPLDRASDYAKVILWIDEKSKLPTQFVLLNKDGYKYVISLKELDLNPALDARTVFTFDPSKYPNIRVEDLR